LDNSAHVDSLNKDGNTPLFCAAERLSSSCGKVKRKKFLERIYWFFLELAFIGIWCGYNNCK